MLQSVAVAVTAAVAVSAAAVDSAASSSSSSIYGQHALFDEAPLAARDSVEILRRAHPQELLSLRMALHQPHFSQIEEHLEMASDPDHPYYGQHMSAEQVQHLSRPSEEAYSVLDWLEEHGVQVSPLSLASEDLWSLDLTVQQAEDLFATEFHSYRRLAGASSVDQEEMIRTNKVHLPHKLHQHVDMVHPTTFFGQMRPFMQTSQIVDEGQSPEVQQAAFQQHRKSRWNIIKNYLNHDDRVQDACNATVILPDCLRALYNYPNETLTANFTTGVVDEPPELGVAGYLGQYANYADFEQFIQDFDSDLVAQTNFTTTLVNDNATNPQDLSEAGAEANLDIQWAASLAYPIQPDFYSTSGLGKFIPDANVGGNSNEPFDVLLSYLLDMDQVPSVLSTSYGEAEQTVPISYANKVCKQYAALAARGMSALHASGDGGVTGSQLNGVCESNDGSNSTMFLPTFPSVCPHVTSVGATESTMDNNTFQPEQVAPYSGGGFSNYFGRPSWQEDAVESYLQNSNAQSYSQYFNASGRAFPDVAAYGTNYGIYLSGSRQRMLGTSASTPTFATAVALMNLKRRSVGKSSLGFLNPFLYKRLHHALNDVTEGTNPGCGQIGCQSIRCRIEVDGETVGAPGFEAIDGWDVASGWGTPDVTKMLDVAMSLP